MIPLDVLKNILPKEDVLFHGQPCPHSYQDTHYLFHSLNFLLLASPSQLQVLAVQISLQHKAGESVSL